MKKIASSAQTVAASLSVVSVASILIAHASAASHKAGYLEFFKVDIRSVDYWPTITDFMNEPLLAILAIITALLLTAAAMWGIDALLRPLKIPLRILAKKTDNEALIGLADEPIYNRSTFIGVLLAVFIFATIQISIPDAFGRGFQAAEQQEQFTALHSKESPSKEVLIHQQNNRGIIKTYNSSERRFEDGYETIDMTDKKFETVELVRE